MRRLLSRFHRQPWAPRRPLGLRWSVAANKGSGSCLSWLVPSLPLFWSTTMCGLSSRSLLIFLHTEDREWIVFCSKKVWVDFIYLCSWWKQSLSPSVLGTLGLRKWLALCPSQVKRWDFLSHLRAHGPPPCRSCYVLTVGFMWLRSKAQWCISRTSGCDLSLAELDSCPCGFLPQFILHKGKCANRSW